MLSVEVGGSSLPFSTAVLARSLEGVGLPTSAGILVAEMTQDGLPASGVVTGSEVLTATLAALAEADHPRTARALRTRHWIRQHDGPLVIGVGGTSGVGKSTVSDAIAQRLGIGSVISTDLVRAVMRSTFHPDLLPTLQMSSFSASKMLRSHVAGNMLLRAYEQQSSVVLRGTSALVRRAIKEGLTVILNGVHLVPGLIDVPEDWPLFFYALTVADRDEHQQRFARRVVGADRDPAAYVEQLDAIRDLDAYITANALASGRPVIESVDFDQTVAAVVDAIALDLQARYGFS